MNKKVKVKYKDIILTKTGQFSGVTAVDLNGCNLISDGTNPPVADYQITGISNGNISYGRLLFDKCNRFTTLDNITYNGLTNAEGMFRDTAIDSIPEGIDWSKMQTCQQMFSGAPITGEISMYLPTVSVCNYMFNNTSIDSLSFTTDTVNNTYTKPVVSGNTIRHLSLTYPNATIVDNALTLPALEDYTVNAPVASTITGSIANINADAIITFNAPQVVRIDGLFSGYKRANLDTVHLPFEQIMSAQSTFQRCSALTSFDIEMPNLVYANSMFAGCPALTGFSKEMPNLVYANSMFAGCPALTGFSKEMPNLVYAINMFSGCTSLTGLTMHLPSISAIQGFLYGCSSLTYLSLSAESLVNQVNNILDNKNYPYLSSVTLNLPSATGLPSFTSVSAYPSLKRVEIVSNVSAPARTIHSAVTDVKFVLPNANRLNNLCSSASTLTGITIVADKALSASNTFNFCNAITNIDDIHFDFSKLKYTQNIFQGCSGLTVASLDLPEVTACSNIFSGCSSLESLNFSAPKWSAGAQPIGGTYPALTSLTLNTPAFSGYFSLTSTTSYPVLQQVDITTNWSGTASGSLTSPIGGSIKKAKCTFRNATYLNRLCNNANNLTNVSVYCPNYTQIEITHTKTIYNCPNLEYAELITKSANSGLTASDVIYGNCPATAHSYCFNRKDDVRLVFTADDMGDATFAQIDCTDDDRIETITSDTIVMLNEMGSYIADPPAGPAEHPNLPININIMLDGVFVTTTPSQLSKGKFTWSKEEHEGWTQWQDKLWFKHEPLEPEPDWIDVDVTDGYTIKDGGAYNCVGRMLIFAIQVNPPVRGVPVTQVYHLTFKNSSLDSLEVMLPLIIKGPDYTGQSIRIGYGGVWDGDVTIYDDGYGYSKIIEYTRTN